jgi:very-short-patch-repair endonuclease
MPVSCRRRTTCSWRGFEVDALWPHQRLVVELDGYEFHRTRAAFERDRARDAALQLAGYRVLRVTSRRLAGEPAAVAETIRSLLEAPV